MHKHVFLSYVVEQCFLLLLADQSHLSFCPKNKWTVLVHLTTLNAACFFNTETSLKYCIAGIHVFFFFFVQRLSCFIFCCALFKTKFVFCCFVLFCYALLLFCFCLACFCLVLFGLCFVLCCFVNYDNSSMDFCVIKWHFALHLAFCIVFFVSFCFCFTLLFSEYYDNRGTLQYFLCIKSIGLYFYSPVHPLWNIIAPKSYLT